MDAEASDELFYDADEDQQADISTVSAAGPSLTGELYGLHRAAFENDTARLSALLQQLPPSDHTLQDPHGNDPLHVAALRGHCEAVTVLLDAGLNPSAKSRRGWTPLHEAIAAGAMPAAKLLYQKMEDNDVAKARAQREQLLETMKEMPDYSLQLKWSVGSSFPGLSLLLRKLAPHDTYTIWKKGNKLRVDGQLIGLDTNNLMPAWKRGHFSLLLDGSLEGRAAAAAAAAEAVADAKAAALRKSKAREQKHGSSGRHVGEQRGVVQQPEQQQSNAAAAAAAGMSSSDGGEQFCDTFETDPGSSSSSSSAAPQALSIPPSAGGVSSSSSINIPAGTSNLTSPAGISNLTSPASPAAIRSIRPEVGAPRLLFVRHFKESYIDLSADLSGYTPEGSEYEEHLDEMLMMKIDSGVGKERLKTRDFEFSPVKSWLGGNQTEKVEGWKCTVYEATGKLISYSKSKARLHLPKDATFYDYLSAEYAEDEVTETLIDPLSAEGMSAMQDSSSHSASSSKKGHRKGGSGSYGGGGEMFADADPDYSDMVWDDKPSSSSKSSKKSSSKKGSSKGSKGDSGAAGEEDEGSGSSGRTMRAKCWMAVDFPMKLTQLLPLLNVIGTANKHLEKVSKFLSKYSDMDMFPVKVQVPLILSIYVLLSFKAFHALIPGTSHPPPDDSFFAVPSHYKRRRLEDALDKAAMGMMRSSGREDGYGADDNFFFGGDEGEDMMLAELASMNDEVTTVESDMRSSRSDSKSTDPKPLDSSQQVSGTAESPTPDSRAHHTAGGSGRSNSRSEHSRSGMGSSHSPAQKRVSFRSQSPGAIGSGLDVDIKEYGRSSSSRA